MKNLIDRNSLLFGVVATLVVELLCALVLWGALSVAGVSAIDHLRWFAVAFVPAVLLLRYYAKRQDCPLTLKSVICTFFVTVVAFFWVLLKWHYVSFQ